MAKKRWLEEIDQKQAELVAAHVALEKLHQRDWLLTAKNEMLKVENTHNKKKVMEIEAEVNKLSGQQNLQQRIHHHAKIKARYDLLIVLIFLIHFVHIFRCLFVLSHICRASITFTSYFSDQQEENNILKAQNEDLGIKLQKAEAILSRMKEEPARYRASSGRSPVIGFDEEQGLNNKLKETEEGKLQLAQKLLGLCTSILKTAGITGPVSDISVAEDALGQLGNRITSPERELEDLKFKDKIASERIRLSELEPYSSAFGSRTDENCQTRIRVSQTPFLSALDR
ncbi:hypothetical protein RJ641_013710 [Dillenia turbinata]|uniref:Uncharacterized protein n=1 Tax=Dillenia turbinata TaxID=194707 RepID=A0AAN8WDY7_9MAGN